VDRLPEKYAALYQAALLLDEIKLIQALKTGQASLSSIALKKST
jgi:hypothetical protein